MQYRYTHFPVLVNVGVPDLGEHAELRWLQGVLFGEQQVTFEESALVQGVRGTDDHHLKFKNQYK